MSNIVRKYNYFYKITNNLNGFYYYGVHSTDDLDDGYMGSGSRLKRAYKEFGMENFTKEILKFFDTREEAFDYEARVVTEVLVMDESCYNSKLGGGESTIGMVTVRDNEGNTFNVYKDDPRYTSGELVHVATGGVPTKDSFGNIIYVSKTDQRYLSGELKFIHCGYVVVRDDTGKCFSVRNDDPRYLSGELKAVTTGKVSVKDSSGKTYFVNVDDPRYLSGELTFIWKDRKQSDDAKRKIGEANSKKQKGKKNSQYGKCWIKNDELKLNKSIKKDDIDKYLSSGWTNGRNMKYSKE